MNNKPLRPEQFATLVRFRDSIEAFINTIDEDFRDRVPGGAQAIELRAEVLHKAISDVLKEDAEIERARLAKLNVRQRTAGRGGIVEKGARAR